MTESGPMGLGPGSVALAAACVSASAWASEPSSDLETYLISVEFSTAEIARMRAGSAIARVLPQPDDDAAFVIGVARIDAEDPGSAKSFYVVRSVRARIDRPRWFGGMALGKIKREMRGALTRELMRTKRRLEAPGP